MRKIILILALLSITHQVVSQIKGMPPSYVLRTEAQTSDIYRGERERLNNLEHTKLDLKFDYAQQHVLGEAWLTLQPHYYATNKLELDAKAMDIHEVSVYDSHKEKKGKKLQFHYDGTVLQITLDQMYSADQTYVVYIRYTAKPNEVKQEGSSAIQDAKGLYFINPEGKDRDKPVQIWTQGETEASSCWFPTIDATNQKTSQEIYLTYPVEFVSLSNGIQVSSKENKDGTKTDYWKFDQKHAPYLFFVGIGDYAVVKDKWRGIDVEYYVEREYAPYAREIFGDTPEMMEFFSELLKYPYPWSKYAQMTARDYVSGAMENTTASLFNENVQQKPGQLIDENTAERVIAHELFHHWFGNLVTAESWSNLALNEAFANYAEYLWMEHKYGREKADAYLDAQMTSYFFPENYNKELIRYHYDSREDMFDAVTYNKGGAVLHMLRTYLGDNAFFDGLHRYLKDNEYGKAEVAQFRIAMEEVSGKDLNWFFDQWFFGSGHPILHISKEFKKEEKTLEVSIMQESDKLFEFPYAIDIYVNEKLVRHYIWVPRQKESTFTFKLDKEPEVVLFNADQSLISEWTEDKSITEYAKQYQLAGENYLARKRAIEELAKNKGKEATHILLEALRDPLDAIRILTITSLDLIENQLDSELVQVLKQLVAEDQKTKVQAQALDALNFIKEYDETLLKEKISSPSFKVQAAAYEGLLTVRPEFGENIEQLNDEVIKESPKLIALFLPKWIENNQLSKADLVAEHAAMYLFVKMMDYDSGASLEQAFKWIMQNDTPSATRTITQVYESYHGFFEKNNPSASQGLYLMLKEGIRLKEKITIEEKTESLQRQLTLLQSTLKKIKG